MVPTADLIPYANNAREHSPEQVAQIAASIKEFRFLNPVIIDGENGIIAGHGRVLAAAKLKMPEVPCLEAGHLTEAQKKAYIIADNKLALNAGWDNAVLSIELAGLQDLGFDLSLTGFELPEIREIMDPPESPLLDNDCHSEPDQVDPIFSPGQCWRVGEHYVRCVDSRAMTVDVGRFDFVLYDPPYDEPWAYTLVPASSLASWISVFYDVVRLRDAVVSADSCGWIFGWEFVWDCITSWYIPGRPLMRHKGCALWRSSLADTWNFDAAIYDDGKERSAKTVSNPRGEYEYTPGVGVHLQSVFTYPIAKLSKTDAHSKPVQWIGSMMAGCSANSVLDMFGGGGVGALAAHQIGASSETWEIDPEKCDRIVRKLSSVSGSEPVRVF